MHHAMVTINKPSSQVSNNEGQRYAVLCCAVLCCAVLCCTALHCAVMLTSHPKLGPVG